MKVSTKLIKSLGFGSLVSLLGAVMGLVTSNWDLIIIGLLTNLNVLLLPITLYVVYLVKKEEE